MMYTTLFRVEHPTTRLGMYQHRFIDCPASERTRSAVANKYEGRAHPTINEDEELLLNMPHELITRLYGLKFAYTSRLQCLKWFDYNHRDLQVLGKLGFVLGLYRLPKAKHYASKFQAVFLHEDAHLYQEDSLTLFHTNVA